MTTTDETCRQQVCSSITANDVPLMQGLVVANPHILEDADVLRHAVNMNNLEAVRYLLQQGADYEAVVHHNGATSLHVAAMQGDVEMMQMFLASGADKDKADNVGKTPLLWATICGCLDVVTHLLEQGCDIDRADVAGWTALLWAAHQDHLDIAQQLLHFGAKLDVRDDDGVTPADVATRMGHQRIADALRAEEIRRRDHGFKRDRSTIEGTEEHAASKRPRAEREARGWEREQGNVRKTRPEVTDARQIPQRCL